MGRVKIPIQPITDEKKRRITFLRRKEGLIKKAHELSTLCDVNVSMIICSDYHQGPEIFPQDRVKLNDMINAYKTKRVSDPRKIKSYGVCDFHKDGENKMEEKPNLEAKFPTSLEFLNDSSQQQLREFANKVETKIKQVQAQKMSNMQNNVGLQGLLKMPYLNPNPITTMTCFDYNKNDNMSIMSNVDNGVYPRMPMGQNNLGLQGLLKMPLVNRNPITTMTRFDYNNNDNTSIMSDSHVESSTGSSNTNVDNGVYPRMPMGQMDQRLMQQAINANMQNNLGLQGLLKMPQVNPNPITTMNRFDYNNNDNTSIMSDSHVESSTGSSNTNVDSGVYPRMPMGQMDQRLMQQAINASSMKREVINDWYDGPNFDLKPDMDMQQYMLSCFHY